MTETLQNVKLSQVRQERSLGIDALRIISMLMVVTLHVLGAEGQFLAHTSGASNRILWFFEAASYCAVDVYAIITGYVCVTQKTQKYSRLMNLVAQALVYSVGIQVVFEIFNHDSGSLERLLISFLPSEIGGYWYFVAYCGLFFLIPLLNKIVFNSSRRSMWKIMIGAFIIFSAAPYIFQEDFFRLSGGFSMTWLAVLYFFGAYLRLHGAPRLSLSGALFGFFVCACLSYLTATAAPLAPKTIGYFELRKYLNGALSYTAPMVLLAAMFLVAAFMKYEPKRRAVKNIIKGLAPFTFGVYLIHLHPVIWDYCKENLHKILTGVPDAFAVPLIIAVIISIYLLCSLIDFVRTKIFVLCHVHQAFGKLEKWLRKMFGRVLDRAGNVK